ncbi:MAG TPA: hypothetical protein VF920_06010 [Dongiaceae bacterium]
MIDEGLRLSFHLALTVREGSDLTLCLQPHIRIHLLAQMRIGDLRYFRQARIERWWSRAIRQKIEHRHSI